MRSAGLTQVACGVVQLHTLVTRFVEHRRSSRIPSMDPIDVLLRAVDR